MIDSEATIGSDLNKDGDVLSIEGSPSETLERTESGGRVASTSTVEREGRLGEPPDDYEAPFYGDRAYSTESPETTREHNDEERLDHMSRLRPSILSQSFRRPVSTMSEPAENLHVTEASDSNQLILALPSPVDSLQALSVSAVNSITSDYSKNWLPPLMETSKVARFEAIGRRQQILTNENTNMLLKHYIDEVAPWVSLL